MIIKASQRGGASQLANYLPNAEENEIVEIHEVKGFTSDNLKEALHEAYILSKATKCKQFLYSVSLNPPRGEEAPIELFENTADRIEKKMGLEGHPRIIVFHENKGRRHAHVVWSRINAEEMKAVNLPFFKNKMMEISKEIFLERGWKLPDGYIDKEMRNPLNFTLAEWQQAKRLGQNPQSIKQTLKECWAISDSKKAFQQALEHKGYYLAKGDRRGFIAVDWRGEPYSLSRWLGVKSKDLSARLGEPDALPTIEEARKAIDRKLVERVATFVSKIQEKYDTRWGSLNTYKTKMAKRHQAERDELKQTQLEHQKQKAKEYQARFHKGIRGFWNRITGKYSHTKEQNELDMYQDIKRDQNERDDLIWRQLQERSNLQTTMDEVTEQRDVETEKFKEALFSNISEEKLTMLENQFTESSPGQSQDHGPTM